MANKESLQKYSCDRCGFDFRKAKLSRQRGMLLSHDCVDDLTKTPAPNLRWFSARKNSTSTDAVNSSTIFSISETGIGLLAQSVQMTHEGRRHDYFMKIIGISSTGGGLEFLGENLTFLGDNLVFMGDDSGGGELTFGAAIITADPQIVAGSNGDRLTLRGCSDLAPIKFHDGNGLSLMNGYPMSLGEGDTLGLVYNSILSVWVETSRNKGGI